MTLETTISWMFEGVLAFLQSSIPRGEIKDLGPDFGIFILAFRDPDNIQIELSAPYPKR